MVNPWICSYFPQSHPGAGSGEGGGGSGLGLAICQAIVRAHGGEIEAQRREAGGARFTFTLPATEGPA